METIFGEELGIERTAMITATMVLQVLGTPFGFLCGSMPHCHESEELCAVFEKFAGIVRPAVFALIFDVTGSSRVAKPSVTSLVAVGAPLLRFVDVDEGRRVQREAEETAR